MKAKKQKTKTNPPKTTLGTFEYKDGAVVLRAPDGESTAEAPAKSSKTVVASQKGTIVVKVADDETAQHAWDRDSELLAHDAAVSARQENASRAKEAQEKLAPRRLRTGSIVTAGTIEDIDISAHDEEEASRALARKQEQEDAKLAELVEDSETDA